MKKLNIPGRDNEYWRNPYDLHYSATDAVGLADAAFGDYVTWRIEALEDLEYHNIADVFLAEDPHDLSVDIHVCGDCSEDLLASQNVCVTVRLEDGTPFCDSCAMKVVNIRDRDELARVIGYDRADGEDYMPVGIYGSGHSALLPPRGTFDLVRYREAQQFEYECNN